MLGSVHDADDALQETLLRAWRGAAGLRDARSARSWLYTIATNVCLTEIGRRRRRVLPHDYGPAADPHTPPGAPVAESIWLEPYPGRVVGLARGRAAPEASYEQHEAIELAFVAALQHLGANQRAVLILREVLGFSAAGAAAMLADHRRVSQQRPAARARRRAGTRPGADAAGNAARAGRRAACASSSTATSTRGSAATSTPSPRCWSRTRRFAMPPLATWYTPRDDDRDLGPRFSLSGAWRWRTLLTRANAQPALAFYAWDEHAGAYLPFALNVLSLRDGLVSDVTAFIVRTTDAVEPGVRALPRTADRPAPADRHVRALPAAQPRHLRAS